MQIRISVAIDVLDNGTDDKVDQLEAHADLITAKIEKALEGLGYSDIEVLVESVHE